MGLVHQDFGVCNVRDQGDGFCFFDWSDAVYGLPAFSCDRFLDQCRDPDLHAAVLEAWIEPPLGEPARKAEALRAARRWNVLHEIFRYHDELDWLEPAAPAYASLRASVIGQIEVWLRSGR